MKPPSVSTVISIISLVIAFAAFVTSWRVQRAGYKLQLQTAKQMGRLESVEKVYPDIVNKLGVGFRVHNGRSEVTVTRAVMRITYTIKREKAIILGKIRWYADYDVDVQSDCFGALGIVGPSLTFRLPSFDEREWRFPFFVYVRLPQNQWPRKVPEQEIAFTFSVTASGNTETSGLFTPGGSSASRYSLRSSHGYGWYFEELLLGVLANEAVRNIESTSPGLQVPPELKRMMLNTDDCPAEFLGWLVDTWENVGSFRDESTEKVARMLVKLGSSHPDPELLSAFTHAISENQPPADLDIWSRDLLYKILV